MHRLLISLLLLFTCTGVFAESEQPPQTLNDLKIAVEKIRQENNVPAIGIALVNKDGPLWIAGLGETNTETHTKTNEDTLFRIGSTSKMFVALAILQLVDEGRLSLDAPIRTLIPEIEFQNPWEDSNPVRVAHLLEHTTGWDDIHLSELAFSAPDTMTIRARLDFHPHSRKSRWVPGTRQAYCNSGATVAAYIIEKITGLNFDDYVNKRLLTPLGMTSTSYFGTSAYLANSATLYTDGKAEPYWNMLMYPSGALNSSAKDMAKFIKLFLNRGESAQGRIISEVALERMELSHTTPGYKVGIRAGYGLANFITGYKDSHTAFYGHNGAVLGGLTELSYIKDQGIGYAFMLNSNNWSAFAQISKLIRSYLLKNKPLPPQQPIKLPLHIKEMEGYYIAINPRLELARAFDPIFGIIHIYADKYFLYQEYLLGGDEIPVKNHISTEQVLIESSTGLPSIAWVNDPLAGRIIQISTDFFRPITTVEAISWLSVFILLGICGAVSLLISLFWLPYIWIRKRPMQAITSPWLWSTSAAILLFIWFTIIILAAYSLAHIGNITPVSISIYFLSLVYPATVALSTIKLYRYRKIAAYRCLYIFACIHTTLHILVTGYFFYFNMIGIKTWA